MVRPFRQAPNTVIHLINTIFLKGPTLMEILQTSLISLQLAAKTLKLMLISFGKIFHHTSKGNLNHLKTSKKHLSEVKELSMKELRRSFLPQTSIRLHSNSKVYLKGWNR